MSTPRGRGLGWNVQPKHYMDARGLGEALTQTVVLAYTSDTLKAKAESLQI